ncbi:hypothetical protein [Demequina aurantiaca]
MNSLQDTFLPEDCDMISSGIKNGDWVEGGMGPSPLSPMVSQWWWAR